MKKNGFTLVEITVVILLLAILALFIVPRVSTIISNDKDKVCDSILTSIEEAAKNYTYMYNGVVDNAITNETYFEITLLDLQKEGLLKVELENPHTHQKIPNTNKVKITKVGNNYTYTYLGDECK